MTDCNPDNILQTVGIAISVIGLLYEVVAWMKRRPNDNPTTILQCAVALISYASVWCGGRPLVFMSEEQYRLKLAARLKLRIKSDTTLSRRTTLKVNV